MNNQAKDTRVLSGDEALQELSALLTQERGFSCRESSRTDDLFDRFFAWNLPELEIVNEAPGRSFDPSRSFPSPGVSNHFGFTRYHN